MSRKPFTNEQIIHKLRAAEVELAKGKCNLQRLVRGLDHRDDARADRVRQRRPCREYVHKSRIVLHE